MKISRAHLAQAVEALLTTGAFKATKYVSAKHVVRATRRRYRGRIVERGKIEIILTAGSPNYAEREFIKRCKRAGEPLPVRKVQLKYPPKRR